MLPPAKGIREFSHWAVPTALVLVSSIASAQNYPNRPVRFITESAAGAIIDIGIRAIAPELSTRLGQPVVIENRTGGNGIVATEACIRAAPDGYTACVVSANTVSFNPNVFRKLPYDPAKDLKPVARLMFLNSALTVNGSAGIANVRDLEAFAKAKPGALNFGTLGPGTQTDVFRQFLAERWKTELVGIPYKSGNLVVNALVAGEIQSGMFALGSIAPQLQGGKARVLAIGSDKRQKQMPDVPTLKEVGLDEGNSRVFWGLMQTAATPDALIQRLNAEIVSVLNEPKLIEFLEGRYLEPAPSTPQEFGAFLTADRAHVAQLVKKYNVPVQ